MIPPLSLFTPAHLINCFRSQVMYLVFKLPILFIDLNYDVFLSFGALWISPPKVDTLTTKTLAFRDIGFSGI